MHNRIPGGLPGAALIAASLVLAACGGESSARRGPSGETGGAAGDTTGGSGGGTSGSAGAPSGGSAGEPSGGSGGEPTGGSAGEPSGGAGGIGMGGSAGDAPTLSIDEALPDAWYNADYAAALTALDGAGGYTWSLASGTLPEGLDLDPAGELLGRPTEDGTFSINLRVDDADGAYGVATVELFVDRKRWLVYSSDQDVQGQLALYGVDVSSMTSHVLSPSLSPVDARIGLVEFSPDGRWLAFTAEREDNIMELYVRDMSGTTPGDLHSVAPNRSVTRVAWSDDSQRLAWLEDLPGDDVRIAMVPLSDAGPTNVVPVMSTRHPLTGEMLGSLLEWVGTRLAFWANDGTSVFTHVDLASGVAGPPSEITGTGTYYSFQPTVTSGSMLLLSGSNPGGLEQDLFDLSTGALKSFAGPLSQPKAFSPDLHWIVQTNSGDTTLHDDLWGSVATQATLPGTFGGIAAWSSAGNLLALSTDAGQSLIDLSQSPPAVATITGTITPYRMHISADELWVVSETSGESCSMAPIIDGGPGASVTHSFNFDGFSPDGQFYVQHSASGTSVFEPPLANERPVLGVVTLQLSVHWSSDSSTLAVVAREDAASTEAVYVLDLLDPTATAAEPASAVRPIAYEGAGTVVFQP